MAQRDYFEKDYYGVLGVPKTATQADIAKAYRKLARELHPDARPDDPEAETRFKDVSEAHAVLSNAEKRKEYDQVRELLSSGAFAGAPGGGFPGGGGGPAGGGGFGPGAQTFDLGDLLGGLFGQAAARGGAGGAAAPGRGPRKGRDAEAEVNLSFEDAMSGVTTTLAIRGPATCSTCHGRGAAPGTEILTCPVCGGTGAVVRDQGLFAFSEPCANCGGRGVQIPNPCPTCGGSGVETRRREIRARIPAGVKDGARIRLSGKGQVGANGGPPGDLYVNVRVAPHPRLGRRGDDLTLKVPITFAEAALGARITVPTMDEPVTLKIPPGTQTGRTFRVKGRGAPKAKGGHGDLLVTVDVAVPRKLTKTQRKLLEDFQATQDGAVRADLEV
ncbi:MAG TPA: molecular chaperone DnaJ [Egibacteraceae bacterium]|nr:molecular chaperone DnaJ [Egibacteraceae bacterium]